MKTFSRNSKPWKFVEIFARHAIFFGETGHEFESLGLNSLALVTSDYAFIDPECVYGGVRISYSFTRHFNFTQY